MERSLLVIEDESLIRWALAKDLSARGYRVETARDAESARCKLDGERFAVVVLSIHLPDGNGLNLLPSIRKRDPSTRVIVVGGDVTPENKRRVFAHGAWQFIDKPFGISEIVNLLAGAFGDHPSRRRHHRYWCRLPLRIRVIEPAPEEAAMDLANLESVSLDVGPGGTRLQTAYRLRPGQRIRIEARRRELPCSGFIAAAPTAEVVWSRSTADGCIAGLRPLEIVSPDRTS